MNQPGCLLAGLAVATAALFLYEQSKRKREGYRTLGADFGSSWMYDKGAYLSSDYGGYGAELSEECLKNPGFRFCSLHDGTPGVCGTSGSCLQDPSLDLHAYEREIGLHCFAPVVRTMRLKNAWMNARRNSLLFRKSSPCFPSCLCKGKREKRFFPSLPEDYFDHQNYQNSVNHNNRGFSASIGRT